jgi:hypothetical protein
MKRNAVLLSTTILLAFLAGYFLSHATTAQAQSKVTVVTTTDGKTVSSTIGAPVILTGQDIGVRLGARQGSRVWGTLVARIDGQWVEVQPTPQDSYIKH